MFTREQAKRNLKSKLWSYRSAAPLLGVSYQHLCEVLQGRRTSRRLLRKVMALPDRKLREEAAKNKTQKIKANHER
jgi:hypothetical protein